MRVWCALRFEPRPVQFDHEWPHKAEIIEDLSPSTVVKITTDVFTTIHGRVGEDGDASRERNEKLEDTRNEEWNDGWKCVLLSFEASKKEGVLDSQGKHGWRVDATLADLAHVECAMREDDRSLIHLSNDFPNLNWIGKTVAPLPRNLFLVSSLFRLMTHQT